MSLSVFAGGPGAGRGKRRKITDQDVDPQIKAVKDKERRSSNNTRERIRIRDINDALTELGRVCMSLKRIRVQRMPLALKVMCDVHVRVAGATTLALTQ